MLVISYQAAIGLWETIRSESLASHHEVTRRVSIGWPECLSYLLVHYPQLEVQLKHDISRRITEEVIILFIDY